MSVKLWGALFFLGFSSALYAEEVPSSNTIFEGVDMPRNTESDPVFLQSAPQDAIPEASPSVQEVRDNISQVAEQTAPPLFDAVQIYTQEELIELINKNTHLNRVKEDECQLVQDIEARADKMRLPSYQFLWGDMLAWGVCVEKDAKLGVHYMWQAAEQGLPAALEQLGRYYWRGTLVQKDELKAVPLLREAANLGFLKAQIEYVEMLNAGLGSPYDYEDAYRWLHGAVISDRALHAKAERELARLAQRMPEHIVRRAKAQAKRY